jgi:outer membrane protein assembly factor BamB
MDRHRKKVVTSLGLKALERSWSWSWSWSLSWSGARTMRSPMLTALVLTATLLFQPLVLASHAIVKLPGLGQLFAVEERPAVAGGQAAGGQVAGGKATAGMAPAGRPALGSRLTWPQFRGPRGDGHAQANNLPVRWNAFRNIAWQTSLPGSGWSSPLVVGDRIWVTAAQPKTLTAEEQVKRLATFPAEQSESLRAYGSVALFALELAADTGKLVRRIELFTCDDPPIIHHVNSYASPTPVTDGDRMYCHFGAVGTVAVDMRSGETLWRRRFVVDEITGGGNSPILAGDRLIFSCDGTDAQYVIALNKATGETVWKTNRPPIEAMEPKYRRAFSSPLMVETGGRELAVVPGAQWVVAYDPRDGKEVWRVNYGDGHAVVPRPVFANGLVYCCTGYPKPQIWAIRVDGQGDVTDSHVAWTNDRQVSEIASPILVGDELYMVSVIGVASCLDARTGETRWQKRLGGNHAASPLFADGKLYFVSEDGATTVLKPGREFAELARNQGTGIHMASPAAFDSSLLFRSSEGLYCLREQ